MPCDTAITKQAFRVPFLPMSLIITIYKVTPSLACLKSPEALPEEGFYQMGEPCLSHHESENSEKEISIYTPPGCVVRLAL